MPSVLVTNHKGGVGKTFLAVHLARRVANQGRRVLLVDCDGQSDAFQFFARAKASSGTYREHEPNLHLIANRECQSIRSMGFEEANYDLILLDADADLASAVKNILQNDIDRILVPVDRQVKAITNLGSLFVAVGKIYGIDAPLEELETYLDATDSEGLMADSRLRREIKAVARVLSERIIVVPLAAREDMLYAHLKKFQIKSKVLVVDNMPWLPDETDNCLNEGSFIWDTASLDANARMSLGRLFDRVAKSVLA